MSDNTKVFSSLRDLKELKKIAPRTSKAIGRKKNVSPKKNQTPLAMQNGRVQQALQYLLDTYPKCFNYKTPRPLKIGIHVDVLNEKKNDEISNLSLRRAIGYYTRGPFYLRCVLQQNQRVDLSGNDCGEVLETEKDDAKKRLEKFKRPSRRGDSNPQE